MADHFTQDDDDASSPRDPGEPAKSQFVEELTTHEVRSDVQQLLLVQQLLVAPREHLKPEQAARWADFHCAHDPLILLILRRYEDRWDKLDDLRQEVWTALIQRLPSLRFEPTKGTVAQWVAGVARRVALRHAYRRSRHQDSELTPELAEELADEDRGDAAAREQALRQEQLGAIVERLAAALPELNRAVVVRHWIDGRPARDIARGLRVAEDRVWGILRRFRVTLSDFLRRHGLGDGDGS